jgi:uncharacterized alkaline shock family protein YloU
MNLVLESAGGTITVPEAVLLQTVRRAAETVDGVRVRRRRSVDLDARTVRLELIAPSGRPLPPLAERVQAAVADAFETMFALDVRVDVAIEELE